MKDQAWIKVQGASENNLQSIDVVLPKNKLIVFTGISGSGKSSLAFGTLYAEGQRRYIESLSTYARQFLGGNEKPNVEKIEGLAPAVAIDQKVKSHNPRSTVGTVTEIYDYLRLLYARVGIPYCINNHGRIEAVNIKDIISHIQNKIQDTRIMVLSPQVRDQKGSFNDLFEQLKTEHFLRVKVDNKIYSLDETISLDKNKRHNIDIVIDRINYTNTPEINSRLSEAIEIALKNGNNLVKIWSTQEAKAYLFSTNYSCKVCGFSLDKLEPRLFSFNAPLGACFTCKGIGVNLEVAAKLLIPDDNLSIAQGAFKYFANFMNTANIEWQKFKLLATHYYIPLDIPVKMLTKKQLYYLLRGSDEKIKISITTASGKVYQDFAYIEGIATAIERRYAHTASEKHREYYKSYMVAKQCHDCAGQRLNKYALSVKLNNLNIAELCTFVIHEALDFLLALDLTAGQSKIANLVLEELYSRLGFLNEVGLGYLTLHRNAQTLSGGEAQRIRLATQIGSRLSGILYVLDEPSIGLHQKDNDRLIKTIKNLQALGNTMIVVEHDEEVIRAADWVLDIGPRAGKQGGQIVYNGIFNDLLKTKNSLTADYLNGTKKIVWPKTRRGGDGNALEIVQAYAHNLKKINVKIPLNKLVVITGVSGSGKSTLMNDVLARAVHVKLGHVHQLAGEYKKVKNLGHIDKLINVTQDPIGKTSRSNPATYTSVFDDIRALYALTPEAQMKGYLKGRFSFNVPGGRCEGCEGDGVKKINMQFLPTVFVTCETCDGHRYNKETLNILFKKKNIYHVLDMTVDEAVVFFDKQPKIKHKLQVMQDVGLGYIKLGQPAPTLSGGEAQRVKLSTFLLKKMTGHTLFLLDEPTTGLHPHDIKKLLNVLELILAQGNSVVMIEHNLDVIKKADYIIDLGPDGGDQGGQVVVTGTPEQIMDHSYSYTAHYLKKHYNYHHAND